MDDGQKKIIKNAQHIYMVGICGMGMTALAQVLKGWGKDVSGSDGEEKFPTDAVLERLKIPVRHGFSVSNIPPVVDLAIISSAYSKTHPEIQELLQRGVAIVEYAQALGVLLEHKRLIAISGTHGKTTTTAMVGCILEAAGMDPTVLVGAQVMAWGSNALVGKSDWVVLEADEYQDKLQYYNPEILVITAIDWDHPDFFVDSESYTQVFRRFAERVPPHGSVIGYGDDVDVLEVVSKLNVHVLTYGRRHHRDIRIVEESASSFFVIAREATCLPVGMVPTVAIHGHRSSRIGPFSIGLFGKHNVSNATAAISVAMSLGVSIEAIRKGLKNFQGTERRMQVVGTMANGAIVIDDYAHHPVEAAATLSGLRQRFADRPLHVVFQPHTYTRTSALINDFAHCFREADSVIITDIFGSAREKQATISEEEVVNRIAEFQKNVSYVPWGELESTIRQQAKADEVWVMMGAGDGWKLARQLVSAGAATRPENAPRNSPPDSDRERDQPTGQHGLTADRSLTHLTASQDVSPQHRDLFAQLIASVEGDEKRVEENVLLSKYTTFRIGGPARWLVKAKTAYEIVGIAEVALQQGIPLFLLSGGANVLVSDEGFNGIVIKCEDRTLTIEGTRVIAGSGVPLLYLAQQTAKSGLTGAEFCAAIPGAVGGAVRGNAGAFGGEMKDIVVSVDIWDGKGRRTLTNEECAFAYRTSAIKKNNQSVVIPDRDRGSRNDCWIVLRATLRLATGNVNTAQEKVKELLLKKSSSQSLEDPSAGCMFKNITLAKDFWLDAVHQRWEPRVPPEFIQKGVLPSAWLIDQAELKGRCIGGAQVSLKHGNFIMNNGNAKASDVLMLVSIIKQKIRTQFGVQLEEEIELVGF